MTDKANELSPRTPAQETRQLPAHEVSMLANRVRKSLPETFAEVFDSGFEALTPVEEDDVPGMGHMQATRAVEDWGKVLSLSITRSQLEGFRNDPEFVFRRISFVIGQDDKIVNSRYTFFGERIGGAIVSFPPNDPGTEREIQNIADDLAVAFEIDPDK